MKEFWSKFEYWKRGAVLGFLFGVLFQALILIANSGSYGKQLFSLGNFHFNDLILHFLPILVTTSNPLNQVRVTVLTFVTLVLWYLLIGLILGFTYQRTGKIKNKNMRILTNLIFLLGILLAIGFINVYLLSFVFSTAA